MSALEFRNVEHAEQYPAKYLEAVWLNIEQAASVVSCDFNDMLTFGYNEPNETTLIPEGDWEIFLAKLGP